MQRDLRDAMKEAGWTPEHSRKLNDFMEREVARMEAQQAAKTETEIASTTTAQAPAPAPKPTTPDRWVVVKDGSPACNTREQMDQIVKYSVQKDYVAMHRVWDTCLPELVKGTEGFVETYPFFSDKLCFRPVGKTRCYWTNKAVVEHK